MRELCVYPIYTCIGYLKWEEKSLSPKNYNMATIPDHYPLIKTNDGYFYSCAALLHWMRARNDTM